MNHKWPHMKGRGEKLHSHTNEDVPQTTLETLCLTLSTQIWKSKEKEWLSS